jgi:hypothetical protein
MAQPAKNISPARVVIRAFDNASRLADLLGLDRSTVGRWDAPEIKGGTDGDVPGKYHRRILELARERKIKLTADEIIFGRTG